MQGSFMWNFIEFGLAISEERH